MAKIKINKFNIPSKFEEKFKGTSIMVDYPSSDIMEITFTNKEEQEIIKDLLKEVYVDTIGDVKTFVDLNGKLIAESTSNNPRKLYCYSHNEFDNIMDNYGWFANPPFNVATISIVSYNPSEYDSPHYYDGDYNNGYAGNNFNLDVDDIGPFWWETKENELYDKAWDLFEDYLTTHDKMYLNRSNAYFNYFRTLNDYTPQVLHVMNCEEAFYLMQYIEEKILNNKVSEIYVHCGAGVSRSQAVVRYILDTYYEYNWVIRKTNPPQTPNVHILSMLKRAYRLTHKDL